MIFLCSQAGICLSSHVLDPQHRKVNMREISSSKSQRKVLCQLQRLQGRDRVVKELPALIDCYSHCLLVPWFPSVTGEKLNFFWKETLGLQDRDNWLGLGPDAGNGGRQHFTLPEQGSSGRLAWVELRFAVTQRCRRVKERHVWDSSPLTSHSNC